MYTYYIIILYYTYIYYRSTVYHNTPVGYDMGHGPRAQCGQELMHNQERNHWPRSSARYLAIYAKLDVRRSLVTTQVALAVDHEVYLRSSIYVELGPSLEEIQYHSMQYRP